MSNQRDMSASKKALQDMLMGKVTAESIAKSSEIRNTEKHTNQKLVREGKADRALLINPSAPQQGHYQDDYQPQYQDEDRYDQIDWEKEHYKSLNEAKSKGYDYVNVVEGDDLNMPEQLDENVIQKLISGNKNGARQELEKKLQSVPKAPMFETSRPTYQAIPQPVSQHRQPVQPQERPLLREEFTSPKGTLTPEIKEFLKDQVYDFILYEALGKDRLRPMIKDLVKEAIGEIMKERKKS